MSGYVCRATVMFCDIRNFTNLIENFNPIKAVQFANEVLAVLGNVVENNGGIVDRFTGDGFMAHFGVKNNLPQHEHSACETVLGLRKRLKEINSERYLNKEIVVSAGVGIHTGDVAVGEINTGQTTQLTILGDTVNTAARIEGLTKYFAVDALLSEETYLKTSNDFKFQKMPQKKLEGKNQQIETFWLLPIN